jgi:hypothetical protein
MPERLMPENPILPTPITSTSPIEGNNTSGDKESSLDDELALGIANTLREQRLGWRVDAYITTSAILERMLQNPKDPNAQGARAMVDQFQQRATPLTMLSFPGLVTAGIRHLFSGAYGDTMLSQGSATEYVRAFVTEFQKGNPDARETIAKRTIQTFVPNRYLAIRRVIEDWMSRHSNFPKDKIKILDIGSCLPEALALIAGSFPYTKYVYESRQSDNNKLLDLNQVTGVEPNPIDREWIRACYWAGYYKDKHWQEMTAACQNIFSQNGVSPENVNWVPKGLFELDRTHTAHVISVCGVMYQFSPKVRKDALEHLWKQAENDAYIATVDLHNIMDTGGMGNYQTHVFETGLCGTAALTPNRVKYYFNDVFCETLRDDGLTIRDRGGWRRGDFYEGPGLAPSYKSQI